MANKKQEKVVETAEEKEVETIPTEEDFKNADSAEEKLGLMKKLLANQKVSEPKKQKYIYQAMANITVVRN